MYLAPCPSAGVTVEGGNIVIQVQVSSVSSTQGNLKQEYVLGDKCIFIVGNVESDSAQTNQIHSKEQAREMDQESGNLILMNEGFLCCDWGETRSTLCLFTGLGLLIGGLTNDRGVDQC